MTGEFIGLITDLLLYSDLTAFVNHPKVPVKLCIINENALDSFALTYISKRDTLVQFGCKIMLKLT